MKLLACLFAVSLASLPFAAQQQPARPDILENWRSWKLAADELEAGTALLDHPWFAYVPANIAVRRSLYPRLDQTPWQALFGPNARTRASIGVRFEHEDGGGGELALGASLFESPAAAQAALAQARSRARGAFEACREVELVEGVFEPVRAAPARMPGKGGEAALDEALLFAAGSWFIVVVKEPGSPVELESWLVGSLAAKGLLHGRFVVEAIVVMLDDEHVRPGEIVAASVWFDCFGRPAKGVEVREHLLLKRGDELLGSIEKPDVTKLLRAGDSGGIERIAFHVPAGAQPGSYSIEAVLDVDGIRASRSATFTVER